ncbi:MAG: cytochrome c family protein [Desulfobulbaceae bacterium]|nr:cytochrome c family protein [Desulfobulbaceae bacterium]
MQKKIALAAAIALALFTTSHLATGSATEGLTAPTEDLVIDGKKPARFPHSTHLAIGIACGTCHHDGEHQELSAETIGTLNDATALRCINCHNPDHPDKNMQNPKDIFHARCKECHKAGYEGKNGPTKCTGCHVEKN